MRQYGYLEQGTPDSEALYNEDAIIEAIKTVQKYGDIPQTGKLDNATLQVTDRQTRWLTSLNITDDCNLNQNNNMNMRATCFDCNFVFSTKYVFKECFCVRNLYMSFIRGVIILTIHLVTTKLNTKTPK